MTKRTFPPDLDDIVLGILRNNGMIHRGVLLVACQPEQICDDSEMRLAIQSLREKGNMICNLEDGSGYFIAKTMEEYEAFRLKYTARASTIFKAVLAMDITARKNFDYHPQQRKLDEVRG